ncbi:MAG: hexitol phosphatase HxpB [bacterium]|jgi:beta-phosphoglucomutase-like phosphatase (HAD superfamily)|nr:hexitol phosphatase HxpB [Chitinophagaceae bacterium]
MKTTTAIFDMDGLLIDSEPLWYEAAQESLTKFGIIIGEEQYVETTGLRTKEFLQHWFGVFNIEHAHIPKTEKVITDLVIAKVMESGTMMEGVNEVMEMVKQSSLKIGLASSSPLALIKAVLAKTKMEQHFSAICSAEFLPFGKPNPQVFINCAIELGSHPAACICFEDSFNGMIAAKAARMKCIVVPHPDQFHQERWNIADLKLDSLRSLAAQDFNALLA